MRQRPVHLPTQAAQGTEGRMNWRLYAVGFAVVFMLMLALIGGFYGFLLLTLWEPPTPMGLRFVVGLSALMALVWVGIST
jgi:hypothetical protein